MGTTLIYARTLDKATHIAAMLRYGRDREWVIGPASEDATSPNLGQPRYHEPGQEEGWTWALDPSTGLIAPVAKPGYTGALPRPIRRPRTIHC